VCSCQTIDEVLNNRFRLDEHIVDKLAEHAQVWKRQFPPEDRFFATLLVGNHVSRGLYLINANY
jgi:hypothetical protein